MTSMNISLPEGMKHFVEAQVIAGEYSTASEYIRSLIRNEQKRQADAKLEALLLEGLDSGPATEITEEDWSNIKNRVRARLDRITGQS
ncbi:MAG: type II toxin-antitoxin system ParD family antitoxin [Prochloraceae cyanobacterium]